mgnify:FL=1
MRAVVFMCGAGGATRGLVDAGLDIRVGVDWWQPACVANRRWLPDHPVVRARCEDAHRILRGPFDAAWASPSCKPWSTANRTASRGTNHREYYPLPLLLEQCFDYLGVRWLVIENVGGLIWSKEGREEMGRFSAAVAKRGLKLSMPKGGGTIASNTLGVAQLRRRVFLVVGSRYVSIRPGSELIPPAGTPPMLWETETAEIGSVLRGDRGEGKDHDWPHRAGRADRGVVDASVPSRHANWTRAEAGVVANEWGRVNGAKRLREQRAQRSVEPGEHPGQHKTRDGHREERSGMGRSLADCCALQQVPPWVVEGFSKRVAHELIGNAVPPPVAEHIGRLILEADAQMEVG